MEILIQQNARGAYEVSVGDDGDGPPPDGEVGLVLLKLSHTLLSQALLEASAQKEPEGESRIVIPTSSSIPPHRKSR